MKCECGKEAIYFYPGEFNGVCADCYRAECAEQLRKITSKPLSAEAKEVLEREFEGVRRMYSERW